MISLKDIILDLNRQMRFKMAYSKMQKAIPTICKSYRGKETPNRNLARFMQYLKIINISLKK